LITGLSFVLSSGAAATALARMPVWVPSTSAVLAAILTAYSMAVGLDKAAPQMAKLHHEWNQLDADYHRLWVHWYEDEAEKTFEELQRRGADVSEIGTGAPFDEKLMAKWEDWVLLAEYGRA
jgi:hypothetical protein